MRDWERIRHERDDLTDYVIHFTKYKYEKPTLHKAAEVLAAILDCGYIRPSFAPLPSRNNSTPRPTVKGPDPAVCLTEQPLSAVLKNPTSRYSHYGIAYHKVHLHWFGGRQVLYGDKRELGKEIGRCEPGWQDGKEIFHGGLPPEMQYLWVRYHPTFPGDDEYPVDFTWEREWRVKVSEPGLPVVLPHDTQTPARGAIIVERDKDVPDLRQALERLAASGSPWAGRLQRVISLETAKQKLAEGDARFGRIETWPLEA